MWVAEFTCLGSAVQNNSEQERKPGRLEWVESSPFCLFASFKICNLFQLL